MVLLRFVGLGLLGFVLLLVGGYVVRGLVGTVEVSRARDRVVADLAEQLPAADRQAQQDMATLRGRLTGSQGVGGPAGIAGLAGPAYSWRELDCGFSSRDAGWIVQSYEQECAVRSVELYAVSSALVADARCQVVGTSGVDRMGRVVVGPASTLTGGDRDWACPEDPTRAPDGSRLLDGTRPGDLSSSPAWVVAETRSERIVTDIGCSPWVVVLCNQPYDVPLTG